MKRNFVLTIVIVVGMLAVGAGLFVASPATDSAQADQEVVSTASTSTTQAGPTPAQVKLWTDTVNLNTWNRAVWINKTNERLWVERQNQLAEAERQAAAKAEAKAQAAADAEAAAASRRAAPAPSPEPSPAPAPAPSGESVGDHGGVCNGYDLPPCYVVQRESGFNPTAENPTSTASGLYQFIDSTWAGFGGYSHAAYAPVSVQVAKARIVWANGAGCSHWSAC